MMKNNIYVHSTPFLIQSVSSEDYDSLRKLALKYPLLNLPADKELLKKKIEISLASFSGLLTKEKSNFLFVLKWKGRIVGSSQMAGKSGVEENPSYSLKIFEENKQSFLRLITNMDGPSYLGGLILDEDYRGHAEKAGKQISLIRFLFAAMYPDFFEDRLHAEVAPFLNESGKNPFFENFINKITHLSMEEIDYLTLTDKKNLFAFYPRGKIFLSSFPESVQKSLGKPGLLSQKAAGILKKQNFYFTGELDPFDGGPYMQSKIKNIPLVQKIQKVFLTGIFEETHPKVSKKTEQEQKERKWFWGKMENSQFKGGVLTAVLKKDQLVVSKNHFNCFSLKEQDILFISPFE